MTSTSPWVSRHCGLLRARWPARVPASGSWSIGSVVAVSPSAVRLTRSTAPGAASSWSSASSGAAKAAGTYISASGRLSVEDLLDDAAGVPGGAPVVVDELAGVQVRSVAARPRDTGQLQPGTRQLVAGPATDQEDRVARPGGQLPGGLQRVALLGGEQATLGEDGERVDGLGHPQVGVLGGVLELQQLDGPLDVGQPAAAQLRVRRRVRAARQPLALHPRLDPADLG